MARSTLSRRIVAALLGVLVVAALAVRTAAWAGARPAALTNSEAAAPGQKQTVTAEDFPADSNRRTILQNLARTGKFKTLISALAAANLTREVDQPGRMLFAPSDAAFAKLPPNTVQTLVKAADPQNLDELMMNHLTLFDDRLTSFTGDTDLMTLRKARYPTTPSAWSRTGSLYGEPLVLQKRSGGLFVDGVPVVVCDVPCKNGVVHVIDEVLVPR